jgi:hypothetical protein
MKPIRLKAYLKLHAQAYPGINLAQAKSRLEAAIAAHRKGVHCACGEPIWVIGSAEAGLACFRCITGEDDSRGDYEIAGIG